MKSGNTSDENDRISTEEFGNLLVLDGTDSDGTDARSSFLLDDETGDGNMVYDQTASGIDVGEISYTKVVLTFQNKMLP